MNISANAAHRTEDWMFQRTSRRYSGELIRSKPPIRHIHPFTWLCAAAIVCGAIIAILT